eukprot:m.17972 g.17972  ORF g.17972 m.17972 type:complete len:557 (+) comp7626_c0_seq2:158-1828(+)
MHGRVKVRTTAEQEAIKRKERQAKAAAFLKGKEKLFLLRQQGVHNDATLEATGKLLEQLPDFATLFSFRREILLALISQNDDAKQRYLNSELEFIVVCLKRNPKSYGAWFQRQWVMTQFGVDAPWEAELDLCNKYLELDERNFHCWDYRRFVARGIQGERDFVVDQELEYTSRKIEANYSNYSAWHYRSKLLMEQHKCQSGLALPADLVAQELDMCMQAVFIDPADQSTWIYIQWLLSEDMSRVELRNATMQCSATSVSWLLHFSANVKLVPSNVSVPELQGTVPTCTVVADSAQMWRVTFPLTSEPAPTLHLKVHLPHQSVEELIEFAATDTGMVRSLHPRIPVSATLDADLKQTIEEALENITELLQDLEGSDAKWCLATLAQLKATLQLAPHDVTTAHELYQQLQKVDPLRTGYINAMRSRLYLSALSVEGASASLNLAGTCLTSLHGVWEHPWVTEVHVNDNQLTSLQQLAALPKLGRVVAQNNNISTFPLSLLRQVPNLAHLDLRGNPLADIDSEAVLKETQAAILLDASLPDPVKEQLASLLPNTTIQFF